MTVFTPFGPEKCKKEFICTWWTCFKMRVWSRILLRIWTKSLIQTIEKWTKIAFWHMIWTKKAISKRIKSFFLRTWWSRVKVRFRSTFQYYESAILVQIRSKILDQNRIFEAIVSRENELLQLFWTIISPPHTNIEKISPTSKLSQQQHCHRLMKNFWENLISRRKSLCL